jgi:hypothetical protein
MSVISRIVTAMIPMLVLWLSGCASDHHSAPDTPLAADPAAHASNQITSDVRIIEEHWPDGARKLRKTVITTAEGVVLDHGTYTKWHPNGGKSYEATYVNGALHGVETSWHMNGQRRAEAHYEHGLRHGSLRSWDTEGRLRKEENYFNDKPHGLWVIWTAAGEVKWRASFEHGAVQAQPPDS